MHIEASVEGISFDRSNNGNLTSNLFCLASFAPKHCRNCLISKLSMDFEVCAAVFSDFFYLFYFNLLKKEVGLLVSFSKRGELVNFAEFFAISFMREENGVHQCDFFKLLCGNAGLAVVLEDFKHFIQMLKLNRQSSCSFMATEPLQIG